MVRFCIYLYFYIREDFLTNSVCSVIKKKEAEDDSHVLVWALDPGVAIDSDEEGQGRTGLEGKMSSVRYLWE